MTSEAPGPDLPAGTGESPVEAKSSWGLLQGKSLLARLRHCLSTLEKSSVLGLLAVKGRWHMDDLGFVGKRFHTSSHPYQEDNAETPSLPHQL